MLEIPLSAVVAMLAVAVPKATPLILGALAGIFCERSGVVNIAIEGMMLTGAFFGFLGGVYTHSLAIGLAAAIASGVLMGALHGALSINFQVNQIISGTVINVLAVGLTGYLNRQLFTAGAPGGQAVLPALDIPVLSQLPIVGLIFFSQQPITYTALVLVVLSDVVLFRTVWGLRTRAVGEHPLAADTAGIAVNRTRMINVLIGGALAGLGGAYFTIESVANFEPLMTNGRGFIALAAMIFGKWLPFGALGASLLFGVTEALPVALQVQGIKFPYQIVGMLPYVLTIVVLVGVIGRSTPPAASGKPYIKGSRS